MDIPELVIFDIGGTTVVDGGQVAGAFSAALAAAGVTLAPGQLDAVRGASKRQAIVQLLPAGPNAERRAEEVYAAFKAELASRFSGQRPQAVPGVERLFGLLRGRGVKIALNTGFDRDTTTLLLDALGGTIPDPLDALVCGDDVPRGRPAPYLIFRAMQQTGAMSVHAAATVGDTALDLHAGRNAGVRWNVGVLSGAHNRAALEAAPHTHILESAAQLTELFHLEGKTDADR